MIVTDNNDLSLTGVVVPLLTPLIRYEVVDDAGMRRLVNHVIAGGVNGVFCMGTTGEFARLSDREWRRAVQVVVEECRGRVPVYVGVSDAGVKRVGYRIRAAADLGGDVVVLSLPYYFTLRTEAEVLRFFEMTIPTSELPVFLYNIPSTTGANLAAATVDRLAGLERVAGIKDSSGDAALLKELVSLSLRHERFSVFVGEEQLMREGLSMGCHGAVPSIANVIPQVCVSLYSAILAGDEFEAERCAALISSMNQLSGTLSPLMKGIAWKKEALSLMGICGAKLSEPAEPLTAGEKARVRQMLAQYIALDSGMRIDTIERGG